LGERSDEPPPILWPFLAALSFGQTAATFAQNFANLSWPLDEVQPEPEWTTSNRVILELTTLRLREFGHGEAGFAPILVIAPLALHHATVADFAPGHSVIEALRKSSAAPLFIIEWKSATAHMRDYNIDVYLADLNVIAEELGRPADYVGLCQGGWLALVFAIRFPRKVRSLVLAGTPVDTGAAPSALTHLVHSIPISVFEELVEQGHGRVLGKHILQLWRVAAPNLAGARQALQLDERGLPAIDALQEKFLGWYAITVDLPGEYYLQVVTQMYKENRLAKGCFVALGKAVDISTLTAPLFVLAGSSDLIVTPEQALAVRRLAKAARRVDSQIEPCGHLSLFMGARTIEHVWPTIGSWIQQAA
jgi:poly(3-hydroxybutyrate) depolymerase